MKHFFTRFNCLNGSATPARDEAVPHTPAEPRPDSPRTRRQAARAALGLPPVLRRPGAPSTVPAEPTVPAPRHLDTVAARPRKLPSPFGLAGPAWQDKESVRQAATAPAGDIAAGKPADTDTDTTGPDLLSMPVARPLRHDNEWEADLGPQPMVPVDTTPVFSQAGVRFAPLNQQVIDRSHRRLTLVTRWDAMARESPAENSRYGKFMAGSVRKTAYDLSTGKIDNFDQLWRRARDARRDSFLVQKRILTADHLTGEDASFFRALGLERHGMPLTTPMTGRYAYVKDSIELQVKEIFLNGKNTAPDQWELGDLSLFHNTFHRRRGPGTYQLRIAPPGNPPAEKQQPVLWNIDTFRDTGTLRDFDKSTSVTVVDVINPMVTEALSAESFAKTFIYSQAQTSITHSLQATGRDDILDHAFEAYWTLVGSAPDTRGSAAKSHYVLQSILLAKGIDLPPAVAGLAPDLEAMSRSRDAWLIRAREVFDLQ